jgi:Arc/MetJ-type ribon-helix-helix transcriptional regulator
MTIHLPENLERSLREEVQKGHFDSLDDAIAAAVRVFLQGRNSGEAQSKTGSVGEPDPKPIWEIADELRGSVADEEWAKLPVDGASQHDHYIYGTPKRPAE